MCMYIYIYERAAAGTASSRLRAGLSCLAATRLLSSYIFKLK